MNTPFIIAGIPGSGIRITPQALQNLERVRYLNLNKELLIFTYDEAWWKNEMNKVFPAFLKHFGLGKSI
tara:strand:- start:2818 stop:3024 length:207 start_codon:yes stop_codon:yes gene_type:complete